MPEPVSLSHRDAAEFAALQAYPGVVQKWKVKKENSRIIYRFHIMAETREEARVTVDWRTQKVLAIEKVDRRQ